MGKKLYHVSILSVKSFSVKKKEFFTNINEQIRTTNKWEISENE